MVLVFLFQREILFFFFLPILEDGIFDEIEPYLVSKDMNGSDRLKGKAFIVIHDIVIKKSSLDSRDDLEHSGKDGI